MIKHCDSEFTTVFIS